MSTAASGLMPSPLQGRESELAALNALLDGVESEGLPWL
jgi:hypothetical protein